MISDQDRDQDQAVMSMEETMLRASIARQYPQMGPGAVNEVVADLAHGSAIIAAAFTMALVGDIEGAAEALHGGVLTDDPDRAAAVVVATQLTIGLGVQAIHAAAAGSPHDALTLLHGRASTYRQIADTYYGEK